jgi:hypothetical protein
VRLREISIEFSFFSVHPDSEQCYYDKKIYSENETWSIDLCTTCTCRAGLVTCAMVQCPVYTHCGYMYKPENECCPKCGGKLFEYKKNSKLRNIRLFK